MTWHPENPVEAINPIPRRPMMAAALKMPCARIRLVASGDPQKPWLALAKRDSPPLVNMDYSAELKLLGKLIPITRYRPVLCRRPYAGRMDRPHASPTAGSIATRIRYNSSARSSRCPLIPSMRSSLFEEKAPRR